MPRKTLPTRPAWPPWPPWATAPAALTAALAGQTLLLAGATWAGALLYLLAAVLLLGARDSGEALRPSGDLPRIGALAALILIFTAALILRRMDIGSIPWGLNNDEGIEGLIACRFLSGARITPFSTIGLSRETLFHVLLLPLFRLLGPGISALRLLSLLVSLATLPVLVLTGREFFSARAGLLAAALMAFSPWHLLYSRTGLRNILLPLFVLAALASFHRAVNGHRLGWFAAAGTVLGIGMYSYTSFRVVLPILLGWSLLRRFLLRRKPLTWRETLVLIVPLLVLLVPQIGYAAAHPGEVLFRGGYVLGQTPRASLSANVLYSLLMPLYYPARFGVMQSLYYFGDGVSLVYAAVGRTPETVVSAALMACGMVLVLSRFLRRRGEAEGVLLLCFVSTLLTVGLAGPSLTRLIGNLPLLCLAGGLFLEECGQVLERRFSPAAGRALVGLLLACAGLMCYEQYFLRAGTSPKAMFYYAAPQTFMATYATTRPPDHPVIVLYSEEPETMEFLTFGRRWVTAERDPSRLDLERIRDATVPLEFVVENNRRFGAILRKLGEIFPTARPIPLSDPLHPSERPVAYVLNADPASGSRLLPPSPSPGAPSPGPEARSGP
jgi:Dolichyl-phosphate-mannose-protein mannosyltransferase